MTQSVRNGGDREAVGQLFLYNSAIYRSGRKYKTVNQLTMTCPWYTYCVALCMCQMTPSRATNMLESLVGIFQAGCKNVTESRHYEADLSKQQGEVTVRLETDCSSTQQRVELKLCKTTDVTALIVEFIISPLNVTIFMASEYDGQIQHPVEIEIRTGRTGLKNTYRKSGVPLRVTVKVEADKSFLVTLFMKAITKNNKPQTTSIDFVYFVRPDAPRLTDSFDLSVTAESYKIVAIQDEFSPLIPDPTNAPTPTPHTLPPWTGTISTNVVIVSLFAILTVIVVLAKQARDEDRKWRRVFRKKSDGDDEESDVTMRMFSANAD